MPTKNKSILKCSKWKDKLQILGLLSLFMTFLVVGYFMSTTEDAFEHIIAGDTIYNPSSKPTSEIELKIHEDDGDIEVDIPQRDPETNGNNKKITSSSLHTNISNQNNAPHILGPKTLSLKKLQTASNIALQQSRNVLNGIRPGGGKGAKGAKGAKGKQGKKGGKGGKGKNRPKPKYVQSAENIPEIEEMRKNASRRWYSDMIDDDVFMYNYDYHCSDKHKKHVRGIITGLYNTGTNVAFQLIRSNCDTEIRWQPQWGKHELVTVSKIQQWKDYPSKNFYKDGIMVVIIKDPLTWIKSMCKANYDFRYTNMTWYRRSCPKYINKYSKFNWLPLNRANIMNTNHTSNGVYESPIHLWNLWYSNWLKVIDNDYQSYLVIRFEDMLFRVESVVDKWCNCLGACKYKKGQNKNKINVKGESAKPHGKPRDRKQAYWSYSDTKYRYKGFTDQDLQYLLDNVNHTLLDLFGYDFDVARTKRLRL